MTIKEKKDTADKEDLRIAYWSVVGGSQKIPLHILLFARFNDMFCIKGKTSNYFNTGSLCFYPGKLTPKNLTLTHK